MTADSPWMTTVQLAAYSQRHQETILLALRKGQLKGYQRNAHASWSIHRDDADRWIRGERPTRGFRRSA